MAVVHDAELDAPLLGQSPRSTADPPLLQDLEDLAQQYASQRTRAELAQAWRPGLNKLDKMMLSLDAWMAHCSVKLRRQLLQKLQPLVQAAWDAYGPAVVSLLIHIYGECMVVYAMAVLLLHQGAHQTQILHCFANNSVCYCLRLDLCRSPKSIVHDPCTIAQCLEQQQVRSWHRLNDMLDCLTSNNDHCMSL